jgi:hypothetical protein
MDSVCVHFLPFEPGEAEGGTVGRLHGRGLYRRAQGEAPSFAYLSKRKSSHIWLSILATSGAHIEQLEQTERSTIQTL